MLTVVPPAAGVAPREIVSAEVVEIIIPEEADKLVGTPESDKLGDYLPTEAIEVIKGAAEASYSTAALAISASSVDSATLTVSGFSIPTTFSTAEVASPEIVLAEVVDVIIPEAGSTGKLVKAPKKSDKLESYLAPRALGVVEISHLSVVPTTPISPIGSPALTVLGVSISTTSPAASSALPDPEPSSPAALTASEASASLETSSDSVALSAPMIEPDITVPVPSAMPITPMRSVVQVALSGEKASSASLETALPPKIPAVPAEKGNVVDESPETVQPLEGKEDKSESIKAGLDFDLVSLELSIDLEPTRSVETINYLTNWLYIPKLNTTKNNPVEFEEAARLEVRQGVKLSEVFIENSADMPRTVTDKSKLETDITEEQSLLKQTAEIFVKGKGKITSFSVQLYDYIRRKYV